MPAFRNLTKQIFGRLTVLSRSENKGTSTMWLCKCECGTEKAIDASSIINGKTRSCGCYRRENTAKMSVRHGYARVGKKGRTYNIWVAMRQRCNDPNRTDYKYYGGRNITVCPEWDSFEQFLADMGECPGEGHSIGREDGNLGYSKSNCQWETPLQQGRNTRHNHLITYDGTTYCMSEWAEILGISYYVLRTRLNKGWTIDRAFNQKVREGTGRRNKPKRLLTFRGKTQSISEWAHEVGIHQMTLHTRLQNGWLIERALTQPIQKRRNS